MTTPSAAPWGLAAAARALQQGALSATELVQDCLDRIAQAEPGVHAWAYIDPAAALQQARERDAVPREHRTGALHGVPLGIKDIIDTHDMPTGYGSGIYRHHRPEGDAACVARAREVGAVVLGKTVSTEFAYFRPGPTVNPHRPGHTPGGSSSGSAAAVACGMVPAAYGTQTAASVIRPASYCGVVGYKATRGAFGLGGIKPFAHSLDSLGLLARSVEDVRWLRRALVLNPGPEPSRPAGRGAPVIRIARTAAWPQALAESRAALDRAVQQLARAGFVVEEPPLPASFETLIDDQKTVMAYEAAGSLCDEYRRHHAEMSPQILQLVETGRSTTQQAYEAALARARSAAADHAAWLDGADAVLTPSATGGAPAGLEATGDPVFSRLWTLLGLPAVSLPGYTTADGLPVGVQLVGRLGGDDELLALAQQIEPLVAPAA